MKKVIIVLVSLIHLCFGQTAWLYDNKITQTYNNFRAGLEEELSGVYQGLNLMFQFDKQAYNDLIRVKTPDDLLEESLQEEGFEDINQWMEYKDEKSKGKLTLPLAYPDHLIAYSHNFIIEEKHQRNLEDEVPLLKEFVELHNTEVDECAVLVNFTQHQYFCNNTRVSFLNYWNLRKNVTFNCDENPKVVNNTSCMANYDKCANGEAKAKNCIHSLPLSCTVTIHKPAEDWFTREYMEEYGYGETCKMLDSNKVQEMEIYINCSQGFAMRFDLYHKTYESTFDYHLLKNDTFWMRDYDNFIFFPWDPQIKMEMKVRDFKYLADSYDFEMNVTDPDQLIGKKPLLFNMDVEKLPKTAKPGGRMFYQIDMTSRASEVYVQDRSGFLALKDYVEPKRSAYYSYTKIITLNKVLLMFVIICSIGLWVYLRRRKQIREQHLFVEH